MSQRLFLLYHFRKRNYTTDELYVMFQTLVLPVCKYSISVWGGLTINKIKLIDKILKRARKLLVVHNVVSFTQMIRQSDEMLFNTYLRGDQFLNDFNLKLRTELSIQKLRNRNHNFILHKIRTNRFKQVFPNRYLFSYYCS
jgi:hypothetical protein